MTRVTEQTMNAICRVQADSYLKLKQVCNDLDIHPKDFQMRDTHVQLRVLSGRIRLVINRQSERDIDA